MFMTAKHEFQKPDPYTPTDYNNHAGMSDWIKSQE